MTYKAVTNTAIDIKKESGVHHEGVFLGKSDISTPLGPQVVWNFVDNEGLPFSIYGFTNLNRAMANIQPDTQCRITYTGKKFVKTKVKPSGMDVHQVLVEVDDGITEQAA